MAADKKLENLENEIRSIIADIVDLSPEKITPDASFVEDLGMDSMMALEIMASLEKKYKLQIPEESLTKIKNLSETVKLIRDRLDK
jgi:acyl carrier protein